MESLEGSFPTNDLTKIKIASICVQIATIPRRTVRFLVGQNATRIGLQERKIIR